MEIEHSWFEYCRTMTLASSIPRLYGMRCNQVESIEYILPVSYLLRQFMVAVAGEQLDRVIGHLEYWDYVRLQASIQSSPEDTFTSKSSAQ